MLNRERHSTITDTTFRLEPEINRWQVIVLPLASSARHPKVVRQLFDHRCLPYGVSSMRV